MRKVNLFFSAFLAFTIMFMFSCQQEEVNVAPSGVEFVLSPGMVGDEGARVKDVPTVDEGMCSLEYGDYAKVVIDGEEYTIDIKQWGSNYKTNLIELDPGMAHYVTSFVVYQEVEEGDDVAIFATPMENSDFGKFVNKPIPEGGLEIWVEEYKKVQHGIEVLCVEEFDAPDFGFVFWDIDLKATKQLCIFVNYCEPEIGHKVATLAAEVFPNAEQTTDDDLIYKKVYADGDYNSEDESNELLCLRLPYNPDPEVALEDQSFFVKLWINGWLFEGEIDLAMVENWNNDQGYLHLNEDCDGNFYPFETSLNIAWEDINDEKGAELDNDLDYNDFVVKTTVFTNEEGLNFKFMPQARGAGFTHEFRMVLPGDGYTITGDAVNVDDSGPNTIVTVYDGTLDAFDKDNNNMNVCNMGVSANGNEKTITIVNKGDDFTYFLLAPFTANLNVDPFNNGPYDLFLGTTEVSTFSKESLDGTTTNEYPNAIVTPCYWSWPVEKADIRKIYGDYGDADGSYIVDFDPDGDPATRPKTYKECSTDS